MSDDDDKTPEGLEDFVKKIFGSTENAEEFDASLEATQMQEAWNGIHEIYLGMKAGGFTTAQANAIMGSYLYNLIAGLESGN